MAGGPVLWRGGDSLPRKGGGRRRPGGQRPARACSPGRQWPRRAGGVGRGARRDGEATVGPRSCTVAPPKTPPRAGGWQGLEAARRWKRLPTLARELLLQYLKLRGFIERIEKTDAPGGTAGALRDLQAFVNDLRRQTQDFCRALD